MRILHVINTVNPEFGGPVEAVRQFTASLQPTTSEVVCLDDEPPSVQWPVRVHFLGGAMSSYSYSSRLIPWLRQNAVNFDAVVVHGIWHYHLVGTWLALRKSCVPYYVVPHGMMNPWFRRAYPLKHAKKALFWHTVVHRSLQRSAAVVFLCEEERRLAPGMFALRSCRHAVAPLGIGKPPGDSLWQREALFIQYPELRGKKLILFLGRLAYMKGCDLLLHAFAEASRSEPKLHLVMCGPDFEGWRPALSDLSKRLGIEDRVTWTGALYDRDKWSAIHAADLLVMPSRCETFPVALLEALGCSTPTLLTDQVCICREIEEGQAGIVCAADADSLADGLRHWLKLSAAQKRNLADAAGALFSRRFELESAVTQHLKLMREFTSNPNTVAE